jgi:hypothetical protein
MIGNIKHLSIRL